MDHEELLGFIKKNERNNIIKEDFDTVIGRRTRIDSDDILNLRIALHSCHTLEEFLEKV